MMEPRLLPHAHSHVRPALSCFFPNHICGPICCQVSICKTCDPSRVLAALHTQLVGCLNRSTVQCMTPVVGLAARPQPCSHQEYQSFTALHGLSSDCTSTRGDPGVISPA